MTNSIKSPMTQIKLFLVNPISSNGQKERETKFYGEKFVTLPFYLASNHGLKVSKNEGELFTLLKRYQYTYEAIMLWFNCFNQNQSNNIDILKYPELFFDKHRIHLKSKAELSWATLNLCRKILEIDLWGWKKSLKSISPHKLWFSYEYEELEHTFLHNGVLDKFEQIKKRQYCDSTRKQIQENLDRFDQKEFIPITSNCSQADRVVTSTILNIEHHAEDIAKENRKVAQLYRKYCKIKLRFYRDFRNHKELQLAGIKDDGSIYMTGKGKRGQDIKKRQKKGFG